MFLLLVVVVTTALYGSTLLLSPHTLLSDSITFFITTLLVVFFGRAKRGRNVLQAASTVTRLVALSSTNLQRMGGAASGHIGSKEII